MRALARVLLLALLAGLVAASAAAARAVPAEAAVPSSDQQVLVLLRLPPQHFRAGPNYGGAYGDGAARAARRRIASRIAHDHGLSLVTGWPMPLVGLDCFVLAVPDDRSPTQVAEALAREQGVVWSEPMHVYRAQSAEPPNDPLFRLQPAAQAWRLADLHAVATGRNVRVAVVDSAVDPTHPDLAGQIQTRQSFVAGPAIAAETHGTGVAGVIAAVEGNRLGVAGVAPGARLMALRACWQKDAANTVCDTLSLAKAMHYAIENGAQVVNLSLAGPPDLLLARLIDSAVARGVVVVAAVDGALAGGGFPASHPGVVPVAMSGGGVTLGIEAPGRDVPTTQPGGRWSFVSGSSYAAAHVSGLFALMREKRPRGPLVIERTGSAVDACATLLRGAAACGATRHAAGEAMPVR